MAKKPMGPAKPAFGGKQAKPFGGKPGKPMGKPMGKPGKSGC